MFYRFNLALTDIIPYAASFTIILGTEMRKKSHEARLLLQRYVGNQLAMYNLLLFANQVLLRSQIYDVLHAYSCVS